ncbi:MAG TPA: chromate efflux transporter [Hyphomicrobiaceae bacterium]|nr:chromate efflux transporter [Hyphomicrobiaceae bacterium]
MTDTAPDNARLGAKPSLAETVNTFGRIGLLSFGGPAAQMALLHRVLVDEKRWLTEQQYLNALSFCMLLPGPEAMQLATYSGWLARGTLGGLIAGLLFVLPGAICILALSALYAAWGNVPFVEALFFGIKAAVIVIVVEALLRIARRALKARAHWIVAALSFVAIFVFSVPFPLLIAVAALYGYFSSASTPVPSARSATALIPFTTTLRTALLWLAIWILPLAAIALWFGTTHVLSGLALFFSKLAVVTFGGAYAVLAYMAQDVVQRYGWLEATEMLDGLGLAETTPGPLILVVEYVGFLAAWRHGGEPAWLMGTLGAVVALWATFAPCFLWIFAGAPYVDWIGNQPRLRSALEYVTAAVVGVILNLAVWFALHVFFRTVTPTSLGPARLWWPDVTTIDLRALAIAGVSAWLLLARHWPIHWVLGIAASLALVQRSLGL